MREPPVRVASTTTTTSARAAMIRLRTGNPPRPGGLGGLDSAVMRCAVDPDCEPRYNRHTGRAEEGSELPGIREAVHGCRPGANQGDSRGLECLGPAPFDEQQARTSRNVFGNWKVGLTGRDKPGPPAGGLP